MSTRSKNSGNSSSGRSASAKVGGDPDDSADSAAAIEPHAQLRGQQGKLLAGIVRREGEWVLGMGGRIAGSSAEAAQVFALIRRAAELHEAEGTPVRLTWSDELKHTVDSELALMGCTLEQFERQLQKSLGGEPE